MTRRRRRAPIGSFPNTPIWQPRSPVGGYGESGFSQYCLDHDGTNDVLSMGDVLDKEYNDAFTLSCWSKIDGSETTGDLISKRLTSGTYRGYELYTNNGTIIYFSLCSDVATNNLYCSRSGMADFRGVWNHYAVTYSGNQLVSGVTIYFNGVTVGALNNIADTLGANTTVSAQALTVGGGRYALKGRTTEPTVWDKELSAAEILEVYNLSKPGDLTAHSAAANVEGWWHITGKDVYPTIADLGSGGNDGTMTNMDSGDIVADSP